MRSMTPMFCCLFHWQFHKWCPDTCSPVVDSSRPPLTTSNILETPFRDNGRCAEGCPCQSIPFDSRVAIDFTGVVAMIMNVSLRKELGGKLYCRLQPLQAKTAWQVIGIQYKPETLRRSPLAEQVSEWPTAGGLQCNVSQWM